MTFKDQLLLDNEKVFMNKGEFAEEVILDGQLYNLNMEDVSFGEIGIEVPGTFGQARIIYITTADLIGKEYVPEQVIDLNGAHWTIKDVRGESGVTVFEVFRYTS